MCHKTKLHQTKINKSKESIQMFPDNFSKIGSMTTTSEKLSNENEQSLLILR